MFIFFSCCSLKFGSALEIFNSIISFGRKKGPINLKIREDKFDALLGPTILNKKKRVNTISGDKEQLYRVFINLIKNAEDSINEKKEKNKLFRGKINIEIDNNKDCINVLLSDNGVGIKDTTIIMTPYFTTKKDGTGLGLPIVSKIINEHKGELSISNNNPGVKVLITFLNID